MGKSYLIKDTTVAERAKIVRDSLGVVDGLCDGCAPGILEMYDDYIYGKKEIAEINAEFKTNYVLADDEREDGGCHGSF